MHTLCTPCSAIHSSVYSTHRAHVCALLHCMGYVSIPVCIPLYQRSCTHPGPQHLHLQDPARQQTWKCTSEVCLAHESTMHIMIQDMIWMCMHSACPHRDGCRDVQYLTPGGALYAHPHHAPNGGMGCTRSQVVRIRGYSTPAHVPCTE